MERKYVRHVQKGRMHGLYLSVCEYDEKRSNGTLTSADVPPDRSRFMAQPYSMNDAEFNVFWEAYDFYVGKEAAHMAWKRLHPTDREKARKVAAEYAEANPVKRFRKSPAAWLAGRCWEDEIVDRSGRELDTVEQNTDDTDMAKEGALQFFPTDLAPDLDPLTMDERGMYWTYVRQAWPYGGPMPVDEVEAVLEKPWLSTSEMFRRRFVVEEGKVNLLWLEERREKARNYSELQASKGRLGGRPAKGIKPVKSRGFTKALPNESPRDGKGIGEGIGNSEEERAGEISWPSWAGENTRAKWEEFKAYKVSQHGFRYRSTKTEQAGVSLLAKYFHDGKVCVAALEEAMAKGWKFPIDPGEKHSKPTNGAATRSAAELNALLEPYRKKGSWGPEDLAHDPELRAFAFPTKFRYP